MVCSGAALFPHGWKCEVSVAELEAFIRKLLLGLAERALPSAWTSARTNLQAPRQTPAKHCFVARVRILRISVRPSGTRLALFVKFVHCKRGRRHPCDAFPGLAFPRNLPREPHLLQTHKRRRDPLPRLVPLKDVAMDLRPGKPLGAGGLQARCQLVQERVAEPLPKRVRAGIVKDPADYRWSG